MADYIFKPYTKVFPKDSKEAAEILTQAKSQGWKGLADNTNFDFILEDDNDLVLYFHSNSLKLVGWDNKEHDSCPDYEVFNWSDKDVSLEDLTDLANIHSVNFCIMKDRLVMYTGGLEVDVKGLPLDDIKMIIKLVEEGRVL